MSKGEATRQTIVRHAMGMASAVGLSGLSIGKLAADLSLSKSGLFAHFRSKEELQLQVLDAAAEEFRVRVVDPMFAQSTPRKRLDALYDLWVGWARHSRFPGGCIFVAAAVELDDKPGPVRERLVRLQRDWIESLQRLAKSSIEHGYFQTTVDPATFAQTTYGIMLGLYFYTRLLHDPQAERRARKSYVGLIAHCRGEAPSTGTGDAPLMTSPASDPGASMPRKRAPGKALRKRPSRKAPPS